MATTASKAIGAGVGGGVGYSIATLLLAIIGTYMGIEEFSEPVVFSVHTLIDASCAWIGAYLSPPNVWKPKPTTPEEL